MLPARLAHVNGPTITRYENGSIKEPNVAVVAALAQVYGVQLVDISTELAEEVASMASLLRRSCAPWDSNPEPADSALALAAA